MQLHVLQTVLLIILAIGLVTAQSPANEKRDAEDKSDLIVADIAELLESLRTLNNSLAPLTPGFGNVFTAIKIQWQTLAVASRLQKAVDDAHASGNFSDHGSQLVGVATADLVQPINSTLTNLIEDKPTFTTAVFYVGDISRTVLALLTRQRKLATALSEVLIERFTGPYKSAAPVVVAQILSLFDMAIAEYQYCTGLICLPPLSSAG